MTIHILEDDPGVSDSLAVLLRDRGFPVRSYPDAETFFGSEPPVPGDAVVIDLHLPGISGANVIRWLQRLEQPPRIVAISGQAQSEIDTQLRGLQINLLRKPLTEDEITAQLTGGK